MIKTVTRVGVLALCLLGWSHASEAFECPRPEKGGPGVIPESASTEQELSTLFGSGDIDNRIGVAVADLQRKYPTVSDTELVNFLIGGYCPVVAQMPNLTDAQKTAKVEHFAATVFQMLADQKM